MARHLGFCILVLLLLAVSVVVYAQEAAVAGDEEVSTSYTAVSSSQKNYERISQQFNNAVLPMPGFTRWMIGNDKVIFHANYNDGTSSEFGAITENGLVTRINPQPYEGSTIKITASEDTIDRILNSSNPYGEFKNAWGSDIKVEGLNLVTWLKMFIGNIVIRIVFFFMPSYEVKYPDVVTAVQEVPEVVDCEPRTGGPGGTPAEFTPEDRARFTNVTDNITLLGQPNDTTCSPTAGAIDLLHWNSTIAPGIVNMSQSDLINDMAKRMNTTANGTQRDNIARGLVSYLNDHNASGNFTVKIYTVSRRGGNPTTKGNVTITPTVEIYSDLQYEFLTGENIIVDVKFPDVVHSMKLIALNTKADETGQHLAAFADPAKGTVVYGGITDGGTVDIYGKQPGKILSFVAVSPKKQ